MALSIISNQAASIAARQLGQANDAATDTAEKLSSGKRVNSAADDAAASAIAARLSAEIAGLQTASVNAGQASSLLQIADGAFQNVEDILTRAKSLAVQAGSEQISDTERSFLDQEFQALKNEIDRIAQDTEFNGTKLVNAEIQENFDVAIASANFSGIRTVDGGTGVFMTTGANMITGNANFATDAVQGINVRNIELANATNATTTGGNLVLGGAQTGAFMLTAATTGTNTMTVNVNAFTVNVTLAAMTVDGGTNNSAMFTFMTTAANLTSIGATAMIGANGSLTVVAGAMPVLSASTTVAIMLNGTATSVTGTVTATLMSGNLLSGTGGSMATADVLLTGEQGTRFDFKVGTGTTATEDEISVSIGGITAEALGLDTANIATKTKADEASDAVSAAIDALQAKRSDVGAAQNRLDFASQNVALARENQEAARSELEDLNVARAITEFSQQQLLVQAGTSTLSQANNLPQNLLQLFN